VSVHPARVLGRVDRWVRRWRVLLPVFIAEFVVLLGFGALLPVLPLFVADQGIDIQTFGLITAAWAIAKLFAEPLFGHIADRTGRHKLLMVVGLVLLAVFMLLPLVFTSAAALFVLRLLAGAAAGMYDPAARGVIVNATAEGERGEAFGLYTAFQMGGFLIGPVIGAIGARVVGGYAFPFVLTGLLTAAAAAYLYVAIPAHLRRDPHGGASVTGPERAGGTDPTPGTVSTPPVDPSPAPLRALLNAPFMAAVVIYFGLSLSFGVYEVTWTLYMIRLGASLEWVGATFMLFGIGVVVVSPFAGRIVDRLGAMRFAAVGSLAIAISGALYVVATEPVFPSIVVPFEAVAEGFAVPALFALVALGTPAGRTSTAQGIFGAAGTVALIVASVVAGMLWERDPTLPFVFFVVGVLVCLAIGSAIYAARGPRKAAAPVAACLAAAVLLVSCSGSIVPRPRVTPSPTPSAGPTLATSAVATPQPPPTPTPGPTPMTYRVRSGDTLSRIAARFLRTIGQLITANPEITDPNHVEIGQVLVIPDADAPDIPPSIAVVQDARNDLVDRSGFDVSGQGYTDLEGFAVRFREFDLSMELQLLSTPPSVDPSVETISYTINVDADVDGEPDYTIVYGNAVGDPATYAASLRNRVTGEELSGAFFPGTVEETAKSIRIAVALSALSTANGGGDYAVAALVERSFFPGGPADPEVEYSVDMAPDQQWPQVNARWLTVGG
jgi:DHA1 family multidrug resistance protein-like MFS transporter